MYKFQFEMFSIENKIKYPTPYHMFNWKFIWSMFHVICQELNC